MNLTASQSILTNALNDLIFKALPTISSPELHILFKQFEVKSLVLLLEDGEKIHGRTLVDKAIAQANRIQLVLAPRAQTLANSTIPEFQPEPPANTAANSNLTNPQTEIVEAFQKAKSGHRFVALKWFRDQWLPNQKFSWCKDPEQIRVHLRAAIDQGILRKELLPNPNNPDHPTTTLQQGNSVTENSSTPSGVNKKFSPLAISGKPLSQSVIEGR